MTDYAPGAHLADALAAARSPRCGQRLVAQRYAAALAAGADLRALDAAVLRRWPRGLARVRRLAGAIRKGVRNA